MDSRYISSFKLFGLASFSTYSHPIPYEVRDGHPHKCNGDIHAARERGAVGDNHRDSDYGRDSDDSISSRDRIHLLWLDWGCRQTGTSAGVACGEAGKRAVGEGGDLTGACETPCDSGGQCRGGSRIDDAVSVPAALHWLHIRYVP